MDKCHPQPAAGKISGGLCLVFPAFNEQENLKPAVDEAKAVLERFADDYEIIIVDDGSTDQTGNIAEQLGKENPRIKTVKHPQNLGYGAALSSGFKTAKLKWIMFSDADRQFNLEELAKFVPHISPGRMVIGYREQRNDPFIRRVYGQIYTYTANLLFGLGVRDLNCAFKVFERTMVEGVTFQSPGAIINSELLLVAKKKGIEFIQIPVSHLPRKIGKQTGGSLKVMTRAVGELLNLYFHRP